MLSKNNDRSTINISTNQNKEDEKLIREGFTEEDFNFFKENKEKDEKNFKDTFGDDLYRKILNSNFKYSDIDSIIFKIIEMINTRESEHHVTNIFFITKILKYAFNIKNIKDKNLILNNLFPWIYKYLQTDDLIVDHINENMYEIFKTICSEDKEDLNLFQNLIELNSRINFKFIRHGNIIEFIEISIQHKNFTFAYNLLYLEEINEEISEEISNEYNKIINNYVFFIDTNNEIINYIHYNDVKSMLDNPFRIDTETKIFIFAITDKLGKEYNIKGNYFLISRFMAFIVYENENDKTNTYSYKNINEINFGCSDKKEKINYCNVNNYIVTPTSKFNYLNQKNNNYLNEIDINNFVDGACNYKVKLEFDNEKNINEIYEIEKNLKLQYRYVTTNLSTQNQLLITLIKSSLNEDDIPIHILSIIKYDNIKEYYNTFSYTIYEENKSNMIIFDKTDDSIKITIKNSAEKSCIIEYFKSKHLVEKPRPNSNLKPLSKAPPTLSLNLLSSNLLPKKSLDMSVPLIHPITEIKQINRLKQINQINQIKQIKRIKKIKPLQSTTDTLPIGIPPIGIPPKALDVKSELSPKDRKKVRKVARGIMSEKGVALYANQEEIEEEQEQEQKEQEEKQEREKQDSFYS